MKHENAHECSCDSEYQDERYGKRKRLHNPKADGTKGKCTVCGKG